MASGNLVSSAQGATRKIFEEFTAKTDPVKLLKDLEKDIEDAKHEMNINVKERADMRKGKLTATKNLRFKGP